MNKREWQIVNNLLIRYDMLWCTAIVLLYNNFVNK